MTTNGDRDAARADIMLVEDNPSDLRFLSELLIRAGHRVRPAGDGELALRSVQAKLPDLILLDVNLPGMTGVELCRRLRADAATKDLPAIFISAMGRTDLKVKALQAGGVDYITKPYDPSELLARIDTHLEIQRLRKSLLLQTQHLNQEIENRKQVDEALRDSEEKFKSISASAQDGIIMMDHDGNISYWNAAAETMFGYSQEEVLGKHLHASGLIVPDRFREAHDQAWPEFRKSGRGACVGTTSEVTGLRKTGEEFPVEFSLSAVRLKDRWHGIGILRDITARKQLETRLSKLSVAVEQSPASIVITDTKGTIEYVNPMFCEVTGYTTEEAIGQNPRILKSGKWPKTAYKKLWDTILAGNVWTGEFENKRKNGELYWETASIRPLRDPKGTITHFLAVKQDITKRKLTEDALRKTESELRKHRDHLEELVSARTAALARINDSLVHEVEERREAERVAEAASRAKGEFLATMSHELRTPLHGILGMTELLLGSGLTREQHKQAKLVKASGDILLRLINDILDFSKIEAGKLKLEIIDFDLADCVECVATLLEPQAAKKGLALSVIVNPAVPTPVRGDPGRLQQILTNLVSNAIKFTEQGQIDIRAVVDDVDELSVSVRISVTDTGIGIPADKQDELFQSFSQIDASHSRRFGGTGLGLAISKQLVEAMGGTIGSISETERGSTFWLCLTLEKGKGDGAPLPIPTDLRQLRVLVVDDNPKHRATLHQQLTSFDIIHELAPDGHAALAMLQEALRNKTPFPLVLVDLQMPGMDGQQLTRKIKSNPDLGNTVLVVLTSAGSPGDLDRMRDLGFSAWLPKPITQSKLLDAMAHALACARTNATYSRKETTSALPSAAPRTQSTDAVILAAEDNQIGQEVLRQVLSKAGYPHKIVATGREAVDAWRTGDFALILMDCQMPEMDGFEAAREIRRLENQNTNDPSLSPRIPILALTANALTGDRERCLEAGMDNHIAKPFDPKQLVEAIDRQLAQTDASEASAMHAPSSDQTHDAQPSVPQPVDPADTPAPPFDMDTVLKRWGGNRDFVLKMIGQFLDSAPAELDRLTRLVADADIEETTRYAHGLKGAAAYCGAEPIRIIAARLEAMGRAGDLSEADECLKELQLELDRCRTHAPEAAVSNDTKVDALP